MFYYKGAGRHYNHDVIDPEEFVFCETNVCPGHVFHFEALGCEKDLKIASEVGVQEYMGEGDTGSIPCPVNTEVCPSYAGANKCGRTQIKEDQPKR